MLLASLCLLLLPGLDFYMIKPVLQYSSNICRLKQQKTRSISARQLPCFRLFAKSSLTDGNDLLSPDLLLVKADLIALRDKVRIELNKPAYVIFTNNAMATILEKLPATDDEIASITPSGFKIYKPIYPDILMILSKYRASQNTNIAIPVVSTVGEIPLSNPSIGSSGLASKKIVPAHLAIPVVSTVKEILPSNPAVVRNVLPSKIVKLAQVPLPVRSSSSSSIVSPEILLSELSMEQRQAAEIALSGQNLFITGSAGTGKSYLMKFIVQELKSKYGSKPEQQSSAVVVTAPTGVAAINVGGQTIHSFAGIGQMKYDNNVLKSMALKNTKSLARWEKCKVLIIDEVSMLSAPLFDLLDDIARAAKRNHAPFGGIQLIVVGDFLQLPPILQASPSGSEDFRRFCFQSSRWKEAGLSKSDGGTAQLEEVIRQKHDRPFINVLNEIRKGRIGQDTIDILNACMVDRKELPSDGITPTQLYCFNKDVDDENKKNLAKLPGDLYSLTASDVWKDKPSTAAAQKLLVDAISKQAPQSIELKVGAQVMLSRNSRDKNENKSSGKLDLVNGSRGVVVRFEEVAKTGVVPIVRFDNGKVTAIRPVEYEHVDALTGSHIIRNQVPLKLAWAITVHKSQGTTLTRAQLMIQNTFDSGQAYVALSRVTGFEGLWLTKPITRNSIRADRDALDYYGYSTFDD